MNTQDMGRKFFKDYPDVLDVGQMSALLSISKKTSYKLLREGVVPSLRIGREYKIPKANLIRYLNISNGA